MTALGMLASNGYGPADLFLKHDGRARRLQFSDLRVQRLAVSRDARVAQNCHLTSSISHLNFAPKKRPNFLARRSGAKLMSFAPWGRYSFGTLQIKNDSERSDVQVMGARSGPPTT
jgi:hypothetical protein